MHFDITPTIFSDYRTKKFKCTVYNRDGTKVRSKKFKDIYDAHNWGCRKTINARI